MNSEAQKARRSQLIGLAVRWLKDSSELGVVRKLLIDGTTYSVQGFVVERRREPDRVLPLAAVGKLDEHGLWLDSPAALLPKNAEARYVRSLRQPLPLLGGRAFTVGGMTLGRIEDYDFDLSDGQLGRLFIRTNHGHLLEARGSRILAVSPHTVLLRDDAVDPLPQTEQIIPPGLLETEDTLHAVEKAPDAVEDAPDAVEDEPNDVEDDPLFDEDLGEAGDNQQQ